MIQLLAGLITYLLLSIYCHEQYNEKVSIKRVREIRIKIRNEFAQQEDSPVNVNIFKEQVKKSFEFDFPRPQGGALRRIHG